MDEMYLLKKSCVSVTG